ncbi:MAG: hypothetical protein CR975_02275 [Gammaproteobacteria bacterium]|nr:MAG: hypothetical protein CR975_02275 [Gammaproteobacteria bacterium]
MVSFYLVYLIINTNLLLTMIMQSLFRLVKPFRLVFLFLLVTIASAVTAQEKPVPEKKMEVVKEPELDKKEPQLAETLPSKNQPPKQPSIKESIDYLKKHPKEMEEILSDLIRTENAERLALLLPAYQTVPGYDPSVIEWGNAIIAEQKGDMTTAIKLYRKINAALPKVILLRFHLSRALYRDKQYEAAKFEFEKLRTEEISNSDKEAIDDYIKEINEKDNWTFNGSLNYVSDPNVNNSSKKGTKMRLGNGVLTSPGPETARGFSYALSADKKWTQNNGRFVALHLGTNGLYYLNNKGYNELNTDIGIGAGLGTARFDVEVGPYLQNRLYASNDNGKLSQYSKNIGLRADMSYWITPQWRYQTLAKLSKDKYIKRYNRLDGGNHQWSNTLLYLANPEQYWYTGLDYGIKKAQEDFDSYQRLGLRFGWGQVWKNGLSSNLSVGFGQKKYAGADPLFGSTKRQDKEMDVGLSLWHRNIHFKGITPRLTWQYHLTNSNQKLFDYDKHNFFVEFRKEF